MRWIATARLAHVHVMLRREPGGQVRTCCRLCSAEKEGALFPGSLLLIEVMADNKFNCVRPLSPEEADSLFLPLLRVPDFICQSPGLHNCRSN